MVTKDEKLSRGRPLHCQHCHEKVMAVLKEDSVEIKIGKHYLVLPLVDKSKQ